MKSSEPVRRPRSGMLIDRRRMRRYYYRTRFFGSSLFRVGKWVEVGLKSWGLCPQTPGIFRFDNGDVGFV